MSKKHSYITPEFQLILSIVSNLVLKTNHPLPIVNVDNKILFGLIAKNNLSALISNNSHLFPELKSLEEPLQRRGKKSLNKNLLLQADLLKIIDLSISNNINLLFFKGHPINEVIYDVTHERTSTDVDIFVAIEELQKMENILLENQFVIDRPNFQMNQKQFELFEKIENEKSYFSPKKTCLDVHFKLFKNPHLLKLPNDENEYIIESRYYNRKIKRFSNAYTLIFLILHGKMHEWEKMIWLIDIVKLTQKMSGEELELAFKIAKENKIVDTFVGTYALCNTAFNFPVPEIISNKVGNKHALYVIQGLKSMSQHKLSKFTISKNKFLLKKDFKYIVYQMSLFPSRDMSLIKVPFAGRFIYPIIRPITYIISKSKN